MTFLAIFALAAGGCASQDEAPAARVASDLSGPKPAGLTFLRAIAAGDARTAREASIGTPQQEEWVVAMVALVNGLRRYDQALMSRFGQEAVPADVDLRQALQAMTQDPIMHLEDGIVSESKESAVIYPAMRGIKLAARRPLQLRRDKSGWKVDLAAMAGEPRFDPAVVTRYRIAGKALSAAAREIQAGRYKTLEQAEQAVHDNIDLDVPP